MVTGKRAVAAKAPVTQGVRVGGRSQRVVSAVLRAAAEELARKGYLAFQIEEVARAAGVNRTSIYRRWPTKAQLVEAALREISPFRLTAPLSGDLHADFLVMMQQVVRWMRTPQGASLRRIAHDEMDDPELAKIAHRMSDEFVSPWKALLKQAKERGEIARHLDERLITQMILAPIVSRLEGRELVDKRVMTTILSVVLAGARPAQKRS